MIPYWEQDFYGDGPLTPMRPVFRLLPETGCDDSVGLCASYFLIQHLAPIYGFGIPKSYSVTL